MRTRGKRIHPALKHGAYTATAVLPGESQAAFDKLHRDLITEFAPSGALEDDIVTTIARLLWRKQNLTTLRIAKLAQRRYSEIRDEKRDEQIAAYNESLWMSEDDGPPAESAEEQHAAEDRARKDLGSTYKLVEIGKAATFDGLTKELEIKERLDGYIDRCLKKLLFLRGLKSISKASSESPQLVQGPSRAA